MLACDDEGLTNLWFYGQKYFAQNLNAERKDSYHYVLDEAKRWLDIYFSGNVPNFTPALNLKGTNFQVSVWEILKKIPYGSTITYKAIAEELGCKSFHAVGGAVGHNPISIIVPCHRVLGSDGSLTGYAGGIERKAALLKLERVNVK